MCSKGNDCQKFWLRLRIKRQTNSVFISSVSAGPIYAAFPFTASRYILTLPGIIFLDYVVNKFVHKEDVLINTHSDLDEIMKIEEILPGFDCGACGYKKLS